MTTDGASAFSDPLAFLPFVSSASVPTGTTPGPVRAVAMAVYRRKISS